MKTKYTPLKLKYYDSYESFGTGMLPDGSTAREAAEDYAHTIRDGGNNAFVRLTRAEGWIVEYSVA